MRHIVLVGLSGSGKTTLGRMAAERFSMPFVDLDRAIAERAGMSIPEIFKSQGEGYFREMETEATMEALSREAPSVIATGGGVVLRRRNVDAMRESGCVVFLDRPVENIARDILSEDGRPLVTGAESLYEMERRRRGLYLAAADTALPNSGNLEDAADRLAEVIGAELRPEGFSVIGDPIGHTLSPAIHGAIFDELGLDAPYNAVRIPARRLADYAETARRSDMRGFNVTIPHKTAIIPFLDEVENEAALCGAVNTVTVRGGRLTGYNTDMGGLLESLGSSGRGYRGEDILLLGAGGAARG
ncbi:MAG: hypothetical protein LBT23_04280, partial [Synergistaceae bacterium]|nr:hypothetical protein [Synergistaceae bacterium]